MEDKPNQCFLLYHLPHSPQKAEIRRALEALIGNNNPIELCFPHPLQPKIFTESIVIRLSSPRLITKLQEKRKHLVVRGCPVQVKDYYGRETEEEVENALAPRVIYVAGIPVKAEYPDLYSIAGGVRSFREFHIPRNRSGSNRHFGFIIVHRTEDRDEFLEAKKIKRGPLKIFFKDFDYQSYVENLKQLKNFNLHSDALEISRQKRRVVKSLFKGPIVEKKEGKQTCDKEVRDSVGRLALLKSPSERDTEHSLEDQGDLAQKSHSSESQKYRFNSITSQGHPFLL